MKIATKTGDKGTTSLIGNKRVNKNDLHLDAYGTTDELNSHVGLLIEWVPTEQKEQLLVIQRQLFDLGTDLATPAEARKKIHVSQHFIDTLEEWIDALEEQLPPMRGFVLPGGSQAAAQAHICRCVTRRMERNMYHLHAQECLPPALLIYANRLSDYFFLLARKLSVTAGGEFFL